MVMVTQAGTPAQKKIDEIGRAMWCLHVDVVCPPSDRTPQSPSRRMAHASVAFCSVGRSTVLRSTE